MSEFQENPSMDDWRYPHDLGTLSHHPFFLGIFHLFMKPTSYSQKTCPNFAGTPKWFINLFWTGQIKIVTWLKIRIQLSTRYFAVNPGIINPERRFKWGKIRGPDFFPPHFRISYSVHFPCYLQHFGAGRCPFNYFFWVRTSNIL